MVQRGGHIARVRAGLLRAARDPEARAALPGKVRRAVARRVDQRRYGRLRTPLSAVSLPDGPITRPDVHVAVILDDFSELALRYEWAQVRVQPERWEEQLSETPVALLFVESAWNGNAGAWRTTMTGPQAPAPELRDLVAWCRDRGIPTVFWNKEDPPNYARFIATARLFDHVFTVDADRLPDYRHDLGHDRVALLPFGAQPRIHRPVLHGPGRVRPVAFAGTYFTDKHDERRRQMDFVLGPAVDRGLEIYSRMVGQDRRYQFPARYRRAIVGSLPYERMIAAYTHYRVFLNVNSVTESPTMCARRLFELSAAQTPVVSGPAASIPAFFGDTVRVVTDEEETSRELGALLAHAEYRDRIGLRAHRRVFDEHLYEHRVDTVLRAVGIPSSPPDRSISTVVPTMRPGQVDHVLHFLAHQSHRDLELVLVTHGFAVGEGEVRARARDLGLGQVIIREAAADLTLGACMNLGVEAASGRYVAKMDDDNVYAEHYLTDLVRAFAYTDAEVVGKWAHYAHLTAMGATLLRFPEAEHRFVDLVQGGTLLVPRESAARLRFEDLPRRVDTTFLDKVRRAGGRVYSTDRFNFVSMRAGSPDGHTWPITDLELLNRKGRLVFYGDPTEHVTV